MSRILRPHQIRIIERLREAVLADLPEVVVDGRRFRPVSDFPRYLVSELGEVFSGVRACRVLRQCFTTTGYPYVGLMGLSPKPAKKLVHRLVATAFVPNPNNLAVVNHINGVKTDPRAENLEWTTYTENNNHARSTRLSLAFGETHYAAKLSDRDVFEIRLLGTQGNLHREIAAKFGVNRQHITKILNGQARVGVGR